MGPPQVFVWYVWVNIPTLTARGVHTNKAQLVTFYSPCDMPSKRYPVGGTLRARGCSTGQSVCKIQHTELHR